MPLRSSKTTFRKSLIAFLAIVAFVAPSVSAQTTWTAPTGDWFDAANWSAGVPNSSTDAQINNNGTAQIASAGASAQNLDLDLGRLQILGAGTLANNGSLIVNGGTTGGLEITAGGHVMTSGAGTIASTMFTDGAAIVAGTGSVWSMSSLTVGDFGFGGLGIYDGGSVVVAGDAFIAAHDSADGSIGLGFGNTEGTLSVSGNLYVGGDAAGLGGHGQINLLDGGVVSATNIVVWSYIGGAGRLVGDVSNFGLISPGTFDLPSFRHVPGTLSMQGNYAQDPAGYVIFYFAGAATGQHDLLTINGTATLNGNLLLRRLDNFTPHGGETIIFLTASGGISGTFSAVDSDFAFGGGRVTSEVIYGPNDIRLVFSQPSFDIGGLSPNQRAVAAALDQAAAHSSATRVIDFLNAEPASALPHDYDLIAPEELAAIYEIGFSQAAIESQNIQRRTDDIRAGSTGFSAHGYELRDPHGFAKNPDGQTTLSNDSALRPSSDNRLGVFVTGAGQFVDVDGDFNAAGYEIATGGVTLGADYRVTNNFAVGLSGTYTHSHADLVDDGHVDLDGGKGGIYATWYGGGFYVDLAADGGWNSYDTRRAALLGNANGETDGAEFGGLVGAGYDWKWKTLSMGPTAVLQYRHIDIDSFTEHGSLAPLRLPDQDEDSVRGTCGLRLSHACTLAGKIFRSEVRAAWQHEFNDRAYPIDSALSATGSVFTVDGPRVGRDSALVGARATLLLNDRISTNLCYDGQVGRSNYNSNTVSGGMAVNF